MPNPILIIVFAVLAFLLAASSDWLEIQHWRAVASGRPVRVALLSILMWSVGCAGLLLCIEVSWWLLPFEAAGLLAGSLFAMRRCPAKKERFLGADR